MYANGRGVEQSDAEAGKWYRLFAELGYAEAEVNLGCSYANGTGVLKDETEAMKWYQLAAEQGHLAQVNLGIMYAKCRKE